MSDPWSVKNCIRQARGLRNAIDRTRIRYQRDPERAELLASAQKLANAVERVLRAALHPARRETKRRAA